MVQNVEVTGGRLVRTDLMPADVLGRYNGLLKQGDALYNAGDKAGAKAAWNEADRIAEPYIEQLKKKEEAEKEPPPPSAANPAPPEGIPDNSEAIAVCTAPDVCKTPIGSSTPPIPYQVYGLAGDDGNYSPDVFYNGYRAMRLDSCSPRPMATNRGRRWA